MLQPHSQAYLDTAHLLRRAGFGATPDEIQAAAGNGLPATTRALIEYDATPDPIDDDAVIERLKTALPEAAKAIAQLRMPARLVQIWWIYRMLATQRPLQEKMVLFWHNHFTSKDNDGTLMLQQNQLYRRFALGNFRTLTLAASRNPEMLRYLNGNQNYKAHPNENYARELMELFTCGRVGPTGKPNYTEDDIKASARAFSGWNLRAGQFFYNPNQHDGDAKTFMGHSGDLNGDDIVDILVALPATASYICGKLFRYFAYADPEPAVMSALIKTYFDSGYEIKPVVEQILTSNAFYSEKARDAVIKSPAEYVIGSVRTLGLAASFAPAEQYLVGDDPNASPAMMPAPQQGAQGRRFGAMVSPVGRLAYLDNQMRGMGQELLAPPTVKGWDGGELWINTDTLQARERFAAVLSSFPEVQVDGLGGVLQPLGFRQTGFAGFGQAGGVTRDQASQIVDAVLNQLGAISIPDATRQTLLDYAVQERNPNQCARGILALVMGTPEYQVA